MKLSLISALLIPLAFAGVVPSGPVARDELMGSQSGVQGNVKRQSRTFDVAVGSASGQNVFIPSIITGANVGDVVNFTLAVGSATHSLTQAVGGGTESCTSVSNGVNHVFDPADSTSLNFVQTVLFASAFNAFSNVPGQCEDGMTFSVNA